jgi:hypothetical protein
LLAVIVPVVATPAPMPYVSMRAFAIWPASVAVRVKLAAVNRPRLCP